MQWKWITTLEDLETILYDLTNFTPYECYSITRENEFFTFRFEIKKVKRSK